MDQDSKTVDALMELGRATTAYHDAPPERLEDARLAYEEALLNFQSSEG